MSRFEKNCFSLVGLALVLVAGSCSLFSTRKYTVLCTLAGPKSQRQCLLTEEKTSCSLQTEQNQIVRIHHPNADELTIQLRPTPTSTLRPIHKRYKKLPEEDFTSHEIKLDIANGEHISCGTASRRIIM